MGATDLKKRLEQNVNREAITAEAAEKITNYLRILVETLGEDLQRIAQVPPPGQFSLDAKIPLARPPIPPTVYREPEPEGRLVGQRKPGAVAADDDDVGFIQE